MKLKIQAYWGAAVKVAPAPSEDGADKQTKRGKPIRICDISIDGKLKGSILWDGKQISVQPP